jgi:hypothetical protein
MEPVWRLLGLIAKPIVQQFVLRSSYGGKQNCYKLFTHISFSIGRFPYSTHRFPRDTRYGSVKLYYIMTEHDSIDDAALEIQEEFNALIQQYDNRDVVVRAVTGILATTAYAANHPAKPTSWSTLS